MKRLLAPRLLGTHALAILGIALCLLLSSWQWHRAHTARPATTSNGIAKFEDLSPLRAYLPESAIGIQTRVSGRWQEPRPGNPARIILRDRPADGSLLVSPVAGDYDAPLGSWIVDLLVLDDGSTLGVVRGWSLHPSTVPVARGRVTISGVMQPSEDSGLRKLPAISLLTTSIITQHAHSAVHDGYLVAKSSVGHAQSLGGTSGVTQPHASILLTVSPIIKGTVHQSLHWRNVVYTANWILFAFIVLYMWIRIVRDDLGRDEKVDELEPDSSTRKKAQPAQSKTD